MAGKKKPVGQKADGVINLLQEWTFLTASPKQDGHWTLVSEGLDRYSFNSLMQSSVNHGTNQIFEMKNPLPFVINLPAATDKPLCISIYLHGMRKP